MKKLIKEHEQWSKRLRGFKSELPAVKETVRKLQEKAITTDKDPAGLPEAKVKLQDLTEKIEATDAKIAAIEGEIKSLYGESRKGMVDDLPKMEGELRDRKGSAADMAGGLLAQVQKVLDDHFKNLERPVEIQWKAPSVMGVSTPGPMAARMRAAYEKKLESLKKEDSGESSYWALLQEVRSLQMLRDNPHRLRQEAESKVAQMLR